MPLIHKVYEVDPLECPRCKGPMRLITLIEDPDVIRRILRHLGLWHSEPPRGIERAPPQGTKRPAHVSILFTYHSIPEIA